MGKKIIVRAVAQSESVETLEESVVSDGEAGAVDNVSGLIGSYGDPKKWAKSTLLDADPEDLVEIYTVMPGLFATGETFRDRMWLHDLLDDAEIPYYIEIGISKLSKVAVEAQHIFVEKKNAELAVALVVMYSNPENIVSDEIDEDDDTLYSEDGIPQKICKSCNETIDFDYHTCPHCKGREFI